jgi:aminomethyltransferase
MGMTESSATARKRTPLWQAHRDLGARLVDFGGWDMPVQYTGIVGEHQAVRTAAGLFDISHMGEVWVTGPGALDFLNATLTNDLRKCEVGRGQYTLCCNERGGVVDDLYVYRIAPSEFLLVINASRIQADYAWLVQRLAASPIRNQVQEFKNASDEMGAVAVQGPRVVEFIDSLFANGALGGRMVARPTELKKNEIASFAFEGTPVWLGRTGYTGEDGFEVVAPASQIGAIWARLLQAGKHVGLQPCGLGARDTLRTEMGYPLYGHELDEQTTPLEAGLGVFVSLDKGDFVGRTILLEQKAKGTSKKGIAFKMAPGTAPPRPHYSLFSASGQERIGEVVSGTQSPSLGFGIGMGYVRPEFAKAGTQIQVEIRGKLWPGTVVAKPIYRKPV